ncbi:WUSCHEL-related homeobox [Trifolium repens]|nr:WUSCHEL-related homeobox [Trifolium repens]
MGSVNKHWPSMFKRSDYENSQHGINSFTGGHDDERASQPPKPRWIPRQEQIQILEDIFNSGMMNPPREEIKKIRERLQEYGPVGEINVFYWFQNRKARINKQTQPNNIPRKRKSKNSAAQTITIPYNSFSSSSSYYQNASPNEIVVPNNVEFPTNNGVVNLTNDSPNDTIFGNQNLATDYFHTPIQTDFQLPTPPLFSFPSQFPNMTQQLPQNEILMNRASGIPMNDLYDQGNIQDLEVAMNMMQQQQQQQQQEDPQLISSGVISNSLDDGSDLPPFPPIIIDAPVVDLFSITQFQGVGEPNHFTAAKCTVSIDDQIIEVDSGPFNIRQIFGDEAILVDSSGQLVLTDEWGVTLDSLQHGASYFLVCILSC